MRERSIREYHESEEPRLLSRVIGARFAPRHRQVMPLVTRPFGDEAREAEAANARDDPRVIRCFVTTTRETPPAMEVKI